MEITNNSRFYSIPLVVGRRVAQIVFFDTEGIIDKSYEVNGAPKFFFEESNSFILFPSFFVR